MKLSIITVNLNNKKGLQSTIESILGQSESDFEHIIIDGGSTDGSTDIIKKYEPKYLYIQGGLQWISEADNGIYHAMNKGIKLAKGEYCYFLNSGDTFNDDQVLQDFIKLSNGEDLIYGQVFNNGRIIDYPEQINLAFFLAHTIVHQAVFIKRILFDQHGFYDESLRFVSDWKFFISIFKSQNECTFKKIDKTIANYDGSGITSQKDNLPKLYQESDEVKREWFPGLYEEYEQLRRFSQLNVPNTWQLISKNLSSDSKDEAFVLDVTDETAFLKQHLDLLNRQYLHEVTQYKNLYTRIQDSASYRLGNIIVKPFSKIAKFLKSL